MHKIKYHGSLWDVERQRLMHSVNSKDGEKERSADWVCQTSTRGWLQRTCVQQHISWGVAMWILWNKHWQWKVLNLQLLLSVPKNIVCFCVDSRLCCWAGKDCRMAQREPLGKVRASLCLCKLIDSLAKNPGQCCQGLQWRVRLVDRECVWERERQRHSKL